MKLITVSISHDKAPLFVREQVSFTKRRQAEILKYIKQHIGAEAVILSTCNRCEFYLAGGNIKERFMEYLVSLIGKETISYARIYEDNDCCTHLMYTASGLNSMILGEDQILGQVKDAHEFSRVNSACGKYLNTMFRLAVTGAKQVKTNTLLSKTPVSAATISIKFCQRILGTLNGKNILIIGATGKTGSAVLKNLVSLNNVSVFATSRSHKGTVNQIDGAVTIDYNDRYKVLDEMDAVISATQSPHLVLEKEKVFDSIKTVKTRAFIDLAVPRDIDIAEDENITYRNIDDLREIAEENNKIKILESEKAKNILQKYIDEFRIWHLFTDNTVILNKFSDNEHSLWQTVYNLKAENNYRKFYNFIKSLKERNYEN